MSNRQPGNFFKPLVSGAGWGGSDYGSRYYGYGSRRVFGSHSSSDRGDRGSYFSFTCFGCSEKGHRLAENAPKVGAAGGVKIVCHTCGVEGHKSPDCPNKKSSGAKKSIPISKISV